MTTLTTDLKRLGEVKAPAGFADRLLAHIGMADSYAPFETVLGTVYVAWNRQGVSAASRSASAAEFEEWFRKDVGRQVLAADPPKDLAAKIEDELAGKRRMRFDLRGLTQFEQAVLRKTREIPRGEVRPYGWVAREIGRPAAMRAVGTALANNPIPYFIPCHRVVRMDGKIGNYGGGGPAAQRSILTLVGGGGDALPGRQVDQYLLLPPLPHRASCVGEEHRMAARRGERAGRGVPAVQG